jgi:hypothetical protein
MNFHDCGLGTRSLTFEFVHAREGWKLGHMQPTTTGDQHIPWALNIEHPIPIRFNPYMISFNPIRGVEVLTLNFF